MQAFINMKGEKAKMRKLLKDFYYGNLAPADQEMTPGSELHRAIGRAANCTEQLMKKLNETERNILNGLIEAQFTMDGITAEENFILGFQLGVRMMAECMDDNDGDLRRIAADS